MTINLRFVDDMLAAARYADDSNGRWVTIGAQSVESGGKTKKEGGTPVFISGSGEILKGPKALTGKKVGELGKEKDEKKGGLKFRKGVNTRAWTDSYVVDGPDGEVKIDIPSSTKEDQVEGVLQKKLDEILAHKKRMSDAAKKNEEAKKAASEPRAKDEPKSDDGPKRSVRVGDVVEISGDTRGIRDELKAMGLTWNGRVWEGHVGGRPANRRAFNQWMASPSGKDVEISSAEIGDTRASRGDRVVVSGATFGMKDELKAMGLEWDARRKEWRGVIGGRIRDIEMLNREVGRGSVKLSNYRSMTPNFVNAITRYADKWITLKGPDGEGTSHVKLDKDGKITGGPKGLKGKKIADVDGDKSAKERKKTSRDNFGETFKKLQEKQQSKAKRVTPEQASNIEKKRAKQQEKARALLEPGAIEKTSDDDLRKVDKTLPQDPKTELGKQLRAKVNAEVQRRLDANKTKANEDTRVAVRKAPLAGMTSDVERKKLRNVLSQVAGGAPQRVSIIYGRQGDVRGQTTLSKQRGEKAVERGRVKDAAQNEHKGVMTSVKMTKGGELVATMQDYSRPSDGQPWSWTSVKVESIEMIQPIKSDESPRVRKISQGVERSIRKGEEREKSDAAKLAQEIAAAIKKRRR